jgi:hypothetical protein
VFFNTGFMVLRPNATVTSPHNHAPLISPTQFTPLTRCSTSQLYRELLAAAPLLPSEEAEQSALNEFFHGRWQQLPYTFNFQKHPGTSPSRLQL